MTILLTDAGEGTEKIEILEAGTLENNSLKGAEDTDNLGVPDEEITIAVELGPIVFLQQNSEREKAYTFNFNVRVFPENTGGTIKLEIYENLDGP